MKLTKRGGLFIILGVFLPLLGLSFLAIANLLDFIHAFQKVANLPSFILVLVDFLSGARYLTALTPYFIFFGFLLLVGFMVAYMSFKFSTKLSNIVISRDVSREKLFAGDFLRVTLTVQNSGRLMIDHLYLADLLPDVFDLSMGENFLATSLPPGSTAEFSYIITSPVRGEYEIGPIYLAFQDRAGLFIKELELPSHQEIVFYPRYESVRRMEYIKKTRGSLLTGEHRVSERGQGYDFSRLREYLPTDDIRLVDWKASARMQDLIVREYQKEKNIRLYLLLDSSYSMGHGKREMTKLDYMIRATTFLAYMANRAGDNFGILVYSDRPSTFIPAKSGDSHFFRVINEISRVRHKGTANLPAAMKELARRETRTTVPFILSDLEGNLGSIKEGMRIAVAHHFRPKVIAPVTPYFEVKRKSEEEEEAFREIALEEYLDRRERVKRELAKYRVDVIDIGPEEIIAGALEAYFSSKARTGGIT